jgi:6-phosphofructokinase 1
VERDGYGNVRLSELDLGRLLKERVAASLAARGLRTTIVAKDLGYELRCAPPGGYDIQYCRSLGYWATRLLLEGQTGAMVTIQGGKLIPVPFAEMLDPATGRIRVRMVDVTSEMYQTLQAYMIRLKPEDLADPVQVRALAEAARLDEAAFRARFAAVAGP